MVRIMGADINRKWGDTYRALHGKVDILTWSADADLSAGADIARTAGSPFAITPGGDANGYRLRSGYGTPRLMLAVMTGEDAAGFTNAYLHNNKELRNIYFNVPFDLGDIAVLDFTDQGGIPFEEGSDMYAFIDPVTAAPSQDTCIAMIYYDALPDKDLFMPGELSEQGVSLSLSVTPVANTINFPGDDLITGFVAGNDLPPGSRNNYAVMKLSNFASTVSDSFHVIKHPDYSEHIFAVPTSRAVAYSEEWWNGPYWKFTGDNPPLVSTYGQAGGASVVGFQLAILP